MNPYGTYIAKVRELSADAELRLDFGILSQRFKGVSVAPTPLTQVAVVIDPSAYSFLSIGVTKAGHLVREHTFPNEGHVEAPFDLHVQVYGEPSGVFALKNHALVYLGSIDAKAPFGEVIDFSAA